MRNVVLTYHSHHVVGADYARNDHVAMAIDLEIIGAAGFRIVSLDAMVDRLVAASTVTQPDETPGNVAITFDDGPIYDVQDFVHPDYGRQKSFLAIMREFVNLHGPEAQPGLGATSFVIASPEARHVIEQTYDKNYTFLGPGSMTDDWWGPAIETGLISIANHSWDHLHPALPTVAHSRQVRADFAQVLTEADADAQIAEAGKFIAARTKGLNTPYFAYPFGHYNAFLADEYLPRHAGRLGLRAAFTAEPQPIAGRANPWRLPRYVCGHHWTHPDGLLGILRAES